MFALGPIDADWKEKNPDSNFQFVNDLFGGSIPREFVPAIQKGFETSMTTGVLAGYPMESMKVRVFDGSFHQVDSDSMSFELCAKSGFREAARKAKPVLLEPIMRVEVVTPDQYMGDVTGDLNRRRGMLEGMDNRAGAIPARECRRVSADESLRRRRDRSCVRDNAVGLPKFRTALSQARLRRADAA